MAIKEEAGDDGDDGDDDRDGDVMPDPGRCQRQHKGREAQYFIKTVQLL